MSFIKHSCPEKWQVTELTVLQELPHFVLTVTLETMMMLMMGMMLLPSISANGKLRLRKVKSIAPNHTIYKE